MRPVATNNRWAKSIGVAGPIDSIGAQKAISISTTKDGNIQAAQHGPYDETSYTAPLTFDVNYDTGDITYTKADGKFTFDTGSAYMVDICSVLSISASEGLDQDLQISAGSVWHPATDIFVNAVTEPTTVPVSLILDTVDADFLEYLIDSTATSNVTTHDGSTVTITEVANIEGDPDLHYICVDCDDSTNQNTAAIFPFDQGFYPAPPGNYTTHIQNGIVFTPADGRFTINRNGTYLIQIVLVHEIVTVGDFDWELQKNGVAIWNTVTNQNHQAVDPAVRTIVLALTLVSGDFLELEIDYVLNAGGAKPGTSMAIFELGD